MPSTISLRRRIKSVKNTRQITKAMQMVAASKMRHAQEAAIRSREYYHSAQALLTRLRELTDVHKHPLFVKREVKSRLYIVMTSDSGLAGAYNSNVLKAFFAELKSDKENGIVSKAIVIGRRGSHVASKLEGLEVLAAYNQYPGQPSVEDLRPVINQIMDEYTNERVDAVDILFTDFKSSVVQLVTKTRLLPAAFTEQEITPDLGAAIFEPGPKELLEAVAQRLVEVQLWQAVEESLASEHSMRMMAMKTATDNAGEIVGDLTLELNTARQAAITQELAEITGGSEAIK